MGHIPKVISFQEFSDHPAEVFESVLDGIEIVVQRGEGESITLKPGVAAIDDKVVQKRIEAILAASGSWSDIDTDKLLAELRASRDILARPVELIEPTNGEQLLPEKLLTFFSAAGGWADMDTETLKAQIRASRDMPPRPAVEL